MLRPAYMTLGVILPLLAVVQGQTVKTTDNRDCVFPLVYNGVTYNTCTNASYPGKLWCSTTANYETDRQWGDCPLVPTVTGLPCIFPFIYNDVVYTSCTNVNHNAFWCSLTDNYMRDRQWSDCIDEQTTAEVMTTMAETTEAPATTETPSGPVKTTDGRDCVFPFTYYGKVYTSCTSANATFFWCSTVVDYMKDRIWGVCDLQTTSTTLMTTEVTTEETTTEEPTTSGTTPVTPTACRVYDLFSNLESANSVFQTGSTTVTTCRNTCDNMMSPQQQCVGFEFDRVNNWCFHHYSSTNFQSATQNSNKDQFRARLVDCNILETLEGTRCVFPFQYNDQWYLTCTSINYDRQWCATTDNYNRDQLWGNCPDVTTPQTTPTPGQCPDSYTAMPGVDPEGGEYLGTGLSRGTCELACSSRSDCVGFSFTPATVGGDVGACWMNYNPNDLENLGANAGSIFYMRVYDENCKVCVDGFTYVPNGNVNHAQNVVQIGITTYNDCLTRCLSESGCTGFDFYTPTDPTQDPVCDLTSQTNIPEIMITMVEPGYALYIRNKCGETTPATTPAPTTMPPTNLVLTEKGTYCSIPYMYGGVLYFACINKDSQANKFWCSLTENYDTAGQWEYCALLNCENGFRSYPSAGTMQSSGAISGTMDACMTSCGSSPTCLGFSYRASTSTCYYHTAIQDFNAAVTLYDPQWTQYRKDDCPQITPPTPTPPTDVPQMQFLTENGKLCKVPYLYNGVTYNYCTNQGSSLNKFWCSLTSNYDQDGQWEYCALPECSSGYRSYLAHGSVIGISSSTSVDFDSCSITCSASTACLGFSWKTSGLCYYHYDVNYVERTNTIYDPTWIQLRKDDCPVVTTAEPVTTATPASPVETENGTQCVFPFIYGGVAYMSCILKDSTIDKFWCGTTSNVDRDGQWGHCKRPDCESGFRVYANTGAMVGTQIVANRDTCYDTCMMQSSCLGFSVQGGNNVCYIHQSSSDFLTTNSIYNTDWVQYRKDDCSQVTPMTPTTAATTTPPLPSTLLTEDNEECSVPFTYNGVMYYQCINFGSSVSRFWCSLTSNYDADGQWGYCKQPNCVEGYRAYPAAQSTNRQPQISVTSQSQCSSGCQSITSCVAYEWKLDTSSCSFLFNNNDLLWASTEYNSQTVQYRKEDCATNLADCINGVRFQLYSNTGVYGGAPQPFQTRDQCASNCRSSNGCHAFDYDENPNAVSDRCFFHANVDNFSNVYDSATVNHYRKEQCSGK